MIDPQIAHPKDDPERVDGAVKTVPNPSLVATAHPSSENMVMMTVIDAPWK